jgi:hypothetical protein
VKWWELNTLQVLAPHLPEPLLASVLSADQAVPSGYSRAESLVILAPYLPGTLLPAALAVARGIRDGEARADALLAPARLLPEQERAPLLNEALAAARGVPEEEARARTLAALVPLLTPERRGPVVDLALEEIERLEGWNRSRVLRALAADLPADRIDRALALARGIGGGSPRSQTLAALAPLLPPGQRGGLLTEALEAALTEEDEVSRSLALESVIQDLPDSLLSRLLFTARDLTDPQARSRLLTALASLPGEQREEVLAEALDAARKIAEGLIRSDQLTALAEQQEDERRRELLAEALAVVRGLDNDWRRWAALLVLAPHLPESLVPEALAVAQGIEVAAYRLYALPGVIPRLPEGQRQAVLTEALACAGSLADDWERACALTVLAPLVCHLPKEQREAALAQMVEALTRMGSEEGCSKMLPALDAPLAAVARLRPLWGDVLHVLAGRSRRHLLADLANLPTVLQALGQPNSAAELSAIGEAIRDVGRWWP